MSCQPFRVTAEGESGEGSGAQLGVKVSMAFAVSELESWSDKIVVEKVGITTYLVA